MKARNPLEFFNKIFAPKEETLLTDEEMATIADLQMKHHEIWRVIKKYHYNEANNIMRQMAVAPKEKLEILQDAVARALKPIKDFDMIKQKHLKNEKKGSTVKIVKDLMYYVTGQDAKSMPPINLPNRSER